MTAATMHGDSTRYRDLPAEPAPSGRSIALIGAGLTNLGVLTGLLDLPAEARKDWTIDCFERRKLWGGVWLPDPNPPEPPVEPESAAYDSLELLALGPNMTFPGRPLPPSTPLFPKAKVIEEYMNDHVRLHGLKRYIHCRHSVEDVQLLEGEEKHPWVVTILDKTQTTPTIVRKRYSTLVIGTGVHPRPRPHNLPGQEQWLAKHSERKIIHSMWYRRPDTYKDRFVIVEGRNPSGEYIAKEVGTVAREIHQTYSASPMKVFPDQIAPNYYGHSQRIVSFKDESVVLEDGSEIPTPPDTSIIRAIGWDRSFPVLGDDIVTAVKGYDFSWDDPSAPLECNGRYIRPLYKTMMAMSPKFPRASLAFPGQFIVLFNFHTGYAQGLWLAHVMANLDVGKDLLPPLEDTQKEVRELEISQKTNFGVDMGHKGYWCLPFGSFTDDYAEALINDIRAHSQYTLPPRLQNGKYVEAWRRRNFEVTLGLYAPWHAAKALGIANDFTKGAKTEQDFADAVERFKAWSDARKAQTA